MAASDIYFGRHIFSEALRNKVRVVEVFVETPSSYEFVKKALGKSVEAVKIQEGMPKGIKGENHQGIAFRAKHDFYQKFSSQLIKSHSFIILCNHIEDVHNLGSIARCAAAFGAGLIVHEEQKSASVTAAVIKSSAGCAFGIEFARVPKLSDVFTLLNSSGYALFGLDGGPKSISIYEWRPPAKIALILGSETLGIESELQKQCESLIRIPMSRGVESLNVSHAAGIAMNWVQYRRLEKPIAT